MTSPNPTYAQQPGQHRGICSLSHQGRSLRFRTNPNSIQWSYKLITKVEDTSGGRVIQLLGTRLGDLEVTAECGQGGWEYMVKVARFFRDLMHDQRDGKPATFEYTTRNWRFKVYATGIPFTDTVTATAREFTMRFKIQEDISGVASAQALQTEIARLKDGIGFRRNQYNDSQKAYESEAAGTTNNGAIQQQVTDLATNIGSSLGITIPTPFS